MHFIRLVCHYKINFYLDDKYKKYAFIIFLITFMIFMSILLSIFIINNQLQRKEYSYSLTDLFLITQSDYGYVYEAKIDFNSLLFKIKDDSIRFVDDNLIINYGCKVKIKNKPNNFMV